MCNGNNHLNVSKIAQSDTHELESARDIDATPESLVSSMKSLYHQVKNTS